jgi:hypothetical protein
VSDCALKFIDSKTISAKNSEKAASFWSRFFIEKKLFGARIMSNSDEKFFRVLTAL